MEAGGLEITEESQDVYRGASLGHGVFRPRRLPAALLRRHLEPLGRLDAGARRGRLPAQGLCPADRLADRASSTSIPTGRRRTRSSTCRPPSEAPDLPMRQTGYDFHRFQFRFSPPTRFAEKYLAEIEGSERITLVLNANLVDLRLDDALGTVAGAVFRSYDPADPGFTVRARAYALCCRRNRERPAPAQLHQPGAGGDRQPHRLGRAVLRGPSAFPDRGMRAAGCWCGSGNSMRRPSSSWRRTSA